MRISILALGLALALAQGEALAAADHPELSEGDEAYSAENYGKAAALYRKDAELGVIAAQVSLAFMYLDGLGVAQDFAQAARWFRQAAEQGNSEAQYNLGLLLQEGRGVARNPVEADQWFILAGSKASAERIEKTMDQGQIAQAKQLAEAWTAKFKQSRGR